MATTTTNYNLIKPDGTDMASPTPFNNNMDTIDSLIKGLADAGSFRAFYGTTTSAQIEAAYTANKPIYCIYNNRIYFMLYKFVGQSSTSYQFVSLYSATRYSLACGDNNTWSNGSIEFATTTALAAKADTTTVNTALAGKLDKSGGTMTGAIGMSSKKITALANGTSEQDAINKGQLDSAVSTLNNTVASKLGLPKTAKYTMFDMEDGDAVAAGSFSTLLGHTVDPNRVIVLPTNSSVSVTSLTSTMVQFRRSSTTGALNFGVIILEFN